ncbi:MAG TPA: hypothetical protein VI776_14125 [Anaerolineales bacterium]|nr:hypothetical protein [Anaerolineales bacterium]
MKIYPLFFFVLAVLLASCQSVSVGAPLTTSPDFPDNGPCDETGAGITVSATDSPSGQWIISLSGLEPGEQISASFYRQIGDDEHAIRSTPVDQVDSQGNFSWVEGQLEPGVWEARVYSLAGATCQTVNVP